MNIKIIMLSVRKAYAVLCYLCKVLENANQSIAIKQISGCLGMGGRTRRGAEGRD